MAKSIKPKNDTFIDSTGIVHNKTLLSEILNSLGGDFTDINRTDLNTFTSGIVIGYGHNLTNSPLDNLNQGHLISVPRHDAEGYVTQYFSPYPTNDVYIRKCEAGTWGKWVLITQNYTLAERCVGTWLDKPLYRKVVNLNGLPNTTVKYVPHGISNLDLIISMNGFARDTTGNYFIPISLANVDNAMYQVETYCDKTNIRLITKSDKSNYSTAYMILEYTKTTDV